MNRTLATVLLTALVAGHAACEGVSSTDPSDPSGLVLERQALTAGTTNLDPVGVAVDPLTGARFILDRSNRLYDLDEDGTLSLRLDLSQVWGSEPMEDLCAVSDTELYTVAPENGLRVNLDNDTVTSHFCIVPGMEEWEENPWEDVRHETHAIACDLASARIYAQPQTVPRFEDEPTPVRSEVSIYDLPSGADLSWSQLPSELFIAGGMAVLDDDVLVLGRDSLLLTYDVVTGELEPLRDLAAYGVQRIEGLAVDAHLGTVLVADGHDGELITLDLDTLRGAL